MRHRRKKTIRMNKCLLMVNAFLVLLIIIGLGYSVLSTDLRINGDIIVKKFRDGDKLYVKSDGSDTTGFGTIAKPYQTLGKAYSEADDTATIYIMDNITVTNALSMYNNKNILLTSCTKVDNTTCNTTTAHSIIRMTDSNFGIIQQNSGSLYLQDITIDGNNVETDYAMINIYDSSITVNSNTTLKNGINTRGGGALYTNNATVILNGGEIINNTAINGGGIFIQNHSTLTSYNIKIEYNTATSGGGGLFIHNDSTATINDISISNNNALESNGGGIWNIGVLNISGGTLSYNSARYGGGIYNTYSEDGAGHINMSNGTISNNTASVYGGGINSYSEDENDLNITISGTALITDNESETGAGGIHFFGGKLLITGGTISNNTSQTNGGGIVVQQATATISGGTISGNKAPNGKGGGIHIHNDALLIIDGGIVKKNTANNSGGISKNSTGTYTYTSGYVCKNNSPTNSYDITNTNDANCS